LCVSAGALIKELKQKLKLKAEEVAFLRCYTFAEEQPSLADLPNVLGRKTRQPWDSRRVDRVRKAIERKRPEIDPIIRSHISAEPASALPSTVQLPGGTWVFRFLRHEVE